jgi:hypothetical protein
MQNCLPMLEYLLLFWELRLDCPCPLVILSLWSAELCSKATKSKCKTASRNRSLCFFGGIKVGLPLLFGYFLFFGQRVSVASRPRPNAKLPPNTGCSALFLGIKVRLLSPFGYFISLVSGSLSQVDQVQTQNCLPTPDTLLFFWNQGWTAAILWLFYFFGQRISVTRPPSPSTKVPACAGGSALFLGIEVAYSLLLNLNHCL